MTAMMVMREQRLDANENRNMVGDKAEIDAKDEVVLSLETGTVLRTAFCFIHCEPEQKRIEFKVSTSIVQCILETQKRILFQH